MWAADEKLIINKLGPNLATASVNDHVTLPYVPVSGFRIDQFSGCRGLQMLKRSERDRLATKSESRATVLPVLMQDTHAH